MISPQTSTLSNISCRWPLSLEGAKVLLPIAYRPQPSAFGVAITERSIWIAGATKWPERYATYKMQHQKQYKVYNGLCIGCGQKAIANMQYTMYRRQYAINSMQYALGTRHAAPGHSVDPFAPFAPSCLWQIYTPSVYMYVIIICTCIYIYICIYTL